MKKRELKRAKRKAQSKKNRKRIRFLRKMRKLGRLEEHLTIEEAQNKKLMKSIGAE